MKSKESKKGGLILNVFCALLLILIIQSCDKSEPVIEEEHSAISKQVEHKVKLHEGILAFQSMDELNSFLVNKELLESELEGLSGYVSYNDKVDLIFKGLDELDIEDISYFENEEITPYVKFITEFGEPSLVPTISSTIVGSVFNENLQIIVGDELIEFDGESSVEHYRISEFFSLDKDEMDLLKKVEVQTIESEVTFARGNLEECRSTYHDHNGRRVVGKIGTTNIFGGYRNDFTIKNQKKRWYGWTDYEADRLVLDGQISYNIDVCIDIDGNPNTACEWFNNFEQGLSCSVTRTWYNTRRETANCSVVPPSGPGHEEFRQNLDGWDASYMVYDSPSTNWRATCTCVH